MRRTSGTVSGIIRWPGGCPGGDACWPLRLRSRAAVTAQMAWAAMTRTVCRVIAWQSRTCD